MIKIYLTATALMLANTLVLQAADNMKAFPPPQKGMVRYVLNLPKQKDESAFKVELIAGRTALVDKDNKYYFGGKIEAEVISGWGFTRYSVSKLGPMIGTRMAPAPGAPKINKFIGLGINPYLIRYNSRLPVVVYAPEGVEVRYRIWKASEKTETIEKG